MGDVVWVGVPARCKLEPHHVRQQRMYCLIVLDINEPDVISHQSAWYYEHLAGIRNAEGSVAFQNISVAPQVVCSNLTSVSASVLSHRGAIESSWQCNAGDCSYVPEHANASINCLSGVIEAITFASFGTPFGTCAEGILLDDSNVATNDSYIIMYSYTGFVANPSCDANTTLAIVEGLCLGQASCSVYASDTVFGDPCYGIVKALAIQGVCSQTTYAHNVTVPVGSVSVVQFPTLGLACLDNVSFPAFFFF